MIAVVIAAAARGEGGSGSRNSIGCISAAAAAGDDPEELAARFRSPGLILAKLINPFWRTRQGWTVAQESSSVRRRPSPGGAKKRLFFRRGANRSNPNRFLNQKSARQPLTLLVAEAKLRPDTVGVAQLVRASDCGSECRGFESPHPPCIKPRKTSRFPGFFRAWTAADSPR